MKPHPVLLLACTVALLSACTSTPAALPTPDVVTMKSAAASGRIGAWASGRIGAWARGMTLSTVPDGSPNTFSENQEEWGLIHLAQGQALAPELGRGVVVAVIDTGLDLGHPAFAGHLSDPATWSDQVGHDADPSEEPTARNSVYGHGTAVAGIILQIAPNARIMPLRALNADGEGSTTGLAAAVDWAVAHGAQVINLSAVSDVDTRLSAAIERAAGQGVYVALPAGNDGVNHVSYPARNSHKNNTLGQFSVNAGAVNSDCTLANWSNHGTGLELTAPGVGIATAFPDGDYALASGTSFATPVLSGSLALALAAPQRREFAGKLALQLEATGTNIDAANPDVVHGKSGFLGSGVVNVEAFLQSIR